MPAAAITTINVSLEIDSSWLDVFENLIQQQLSSPIGTPEEGLNYMIWSQIKQQLNGAADNSELLDSLFEREF